MLIYHSNSSKCAPFTFNIVLFDHKNLLRHS